MKTMIYNGSNRNDVIEELRKAAENGMEIIHIWKRKKKNEPTYIVPEGIIKNGDKNIIDIQIKYVEYVKGGGGRCHGSTWEVVSIGDTLQIGYRAVLRNEFEKMKAKNMGENSEKR
ncbi:MAG: hypothetical protein WA139_03890 [Candidatus Aenigmatarchaeota archaeon]